MVGWPVLVPPHGPCSVVAVRERDPRRRDDEHMAVRTSVLPRTSAVRFRAGLATPRRRDVAATTEHGPWGGTNTGHPTMILTGMTHAHYQPALHPPLSDLGEF